MRLLQTGAQRTGSMMPRARRIALLSLILLGSSMACAPKLLGPSAPSGYFFTCRTDHDLIWVIRPESPLAARLPRVAELVARVQDAQGRPLDGVMVEFALEPAWAHSASITPPRAMTSNGVARAVLEPQTTGVVHVTARMENLTQQIAITVSNSGGPGPGASTN
jgi:hypothetical protein